MITERILGFFKERKKEKKIESLMRPIWSKLASLAQKTTFLYIDILCMSIAPTGHTVDSRYLDLAFLE